MALFHPSEPEHFAARNYLLQQCLRPDPLPFPIEHEYPLVLSPEARQFSFCQNVQQQLCSHANLWPRQVKDRDQKLRFSIGLVGNVATDPQFRGQGQMRSLMQEIETQARDASLKALCLWSDLNTFYQKLGFASLGRELHFHFQGKSLGTSLRTSSHCRRLSRTECTKEIYEQLIAMRPMTTLTLHRSFEEFTSLLTIPWLDIFIAEDTQRILAWTLVGKGYDMMGVFHEWGMVDLDYLLDLLRFVRRDKDLPQCMLLTPGDLPSHQHQQLLELASAVEVLPMALVKNLSDPATREELESLFIWGLDSI